ncbi:SAM-dependent methyltransferase [Rhodococcus sp. SRB_17]|nr:SAM-dependent methyltransferase [Rhodococcus sp. SRB_17]
MSSTLSSPESVLRTEYQKSVAAYWNDNPNDDRVNYMLGEIDGLFHHHYGIGDADFSVLEGIEDAGEGRLIKELHRLETAQANLLLDNLGDLTADDLVLDAGCGRGGTSLMANMRFGCTVDGVSISEGQVGFANDQAKKMGLSDNVKFHFENMLNTGLESGSRQAIWTNETTMYVDVFELYSEFSRLLRPGGRYVNITGAANDLKGMKSRAVTQIDGHYGCNIHLRSEYFDALAANGLTPIKVLDLTPDTIPYWELRSHSELATGVENPFLSSYKDGSFQYLLIVAEKA